MQKVQKLSIAIHLEFICVDNGYLFTLNRPPFRVKLPPPLTLNRPPFFTLNHTPPKPIGSPYSLYL